MGRVLVVEKHPVETSGSEHQLQIPSEAFARFFANPNATLSASIFNPPTTTVAAPRPAKIRAYTNSTNRINGVPDIATVKHALVFIEEHQQSKGFRYEIWWYADPLATQIINGWAGNWKQARSSQHGPGRLWTIVAGIPTRNYTQWGATPIVHMT